LLGQNTHVIGQLAKDNYMAKSELSSVELDKLVEMCVANGVKWLEVDVQVLTSEASENASKRVVQEEG